MSILDKFTDNTGETITFYSYKGGNGRTMALSNVATLLAQQNHKDRVLVIDWDLEAPGLHRFFFQDSLFTSFTNEQRTELYRKVEEEPGLIDLFIKLNNKIDEFKVMDDARVIDILNNIKIDDFIMSTSFSNLFILKAGRFDKQYPDKVNTFNWEMLYNKAPSLIRLFSEKLTKEYKYVLIDSRTGFTDISGICTMLLPQKLVVVFTPNRQSYTGIKDLVIKSTTYRRKSNDMRPLIVFPLPSRIEFSRDDLRAYWRYGNDEKRITGYQNMFQDIFTDVYGLDECNLTEYFEQVQIQQSPNYAYGEEIAIINEKTKDSFSLSKSYEIFTQWLVDSIAPWESKKSDESSNIDTTAAIDFDNIGLEFENKGQHEKALSYYNRSFAIYEELKDKEGLAQIHNKIATLLNKMERFDDAIKHLQKALEIHENLKDHIGMAKDYTNIGLIFEKTSRHEEALKLYDEALNIDPNFIDALEAKRSLKKLSTEQWEELLHAIDQKKCIPFIGKFALDFFKEADNYAFVTYSEVAKLLAERYDYPGEGLYQLPIVAQFLAINKGNENEPKNIVRNILKDTVTPNFKSEKFHKSPHIILAEMNLPIYITTNYDLFLEEALKSQGKNPISEICIWNDDIRKNIEMGNIPSILGQKSQYNPTPTQPLVYHLFGSIEYPVSMVLSEKDYHNFVINNTGENTYNIMPAFLRRELAISSLLFIGFDLDSIDFRTIFQGALNFMSNIQKNRTSIAVIKTPMLEDQNERKQQKKFKEYAEKYVANMFKIIVYWERSDSDQFLQELRRKWETFKNK